jgi:hypothetical protein
MKVILDQTACGLVCHPIGNLDSVSRGDFLNAIGQIRVGRPVIFALGSKTSRQMAQMATRAAGEGAAGTTTWGCSGIPGVVRRRQPKRWDAS